MSGFAKVIGSVMLAGAVAATASAQSDQGGRPAFEVASVKPNKSGVQPYSNFPLNAGDSYVPNGGLFSATNFPLITYIFFAYKLQGNEGRSLIAKLPGWVLMERFDIQARAEGNPDKDQMRLMLRSLLADRFKFSIHTETREVPVLAAVLAKPGKTGPQLQPHRDGAPCDVTGAPASPVAKIPDTFQQIVAGDFPDLRKSILGLPPGVPGRSRLAGRDVTLGYVADLLSLRLSVRPIIDATGLKGTFDFLLEFTPEAQTPAPPGAKMSRRTLTGRHSNRRCAISSD